MASELSREDRPSYDELERALITHDKTIAALRAQLEEARCGEALCGHDHSTQYWELRTNKAERTNTTLREQIDGITTKYQGLMAYYDKQEGTPCEQIRHEQEVAQLRQRVRELEQDVVPRSRYDACNKDWLDAIKKIANTQDAAKIEIERLQGQLAAAQAKIITLTDALESGFMKGAYARLSELQHKEQKLYEAEARILELEAL